MHGWKLLMAAVGSEEKRWKKKRTGVSDVGMQKNRTDRAKNVKGCCA